MSDFNVTSTPGYTWQEGETLTAAKLNLAARPTIAAAGTLGTATISDGSVTLAKWAAGVFTTTAGTVAGADYLLYQQASGGLYRQTTAASIAALGFSGLGTLTVPSLSYTMVMNDGANKTITLQNIVNGFGGLTALSLTEVDGAADSVVVYDNSATTTKRAPVHAAVRAVTDRVITTTGTSTAYVVASGYSTAALATGLRCIIKLSAATGAAPTLAFDGLTAKALRTCEDGAIAAGDLLSGAVVEVVYDAAANSAAGAWLVQGKVGATRFTSTDKSLPAAGGYVTWGSGDGYTLAAKPKTVRVVFTCTTLGTGGYANGYAVGDEVGSEMFFLDAYCPMAAARITATTINVVFGYVSGTDYVLHATTGAATVMLRSQWTVKVIAGA